MQGSASDILKKAIIEIMAQFDMEFEETDRKPKILLQIHDEVIVVELNSKYFQLLI